MQATARVMVHFLAFMAVALRVAQHFLSRAAQESSVGRGFIFALMGLAAVNAGLPILVRRLTPAGWELAFVLSAAVVNGAALALAAGVVPEFRIPNAGHAIVAVAAMVVISYVFALWGGRAFASAPPTRNR